MTTPRCFGYLRVSTEQQAAEVQTSIADQRAAITVLADRLGVVVDAWFVDAGASGATAEKRPEFMRMVAAAQAAPRHARNPGYVLVLNDSRFGRFGDIAEAGHWRVVFRKLGWRVRFCEGDDLGDGMAREFVRLVSSAQASEYLQNLKANAMRGSRGAAAQGFWLAGAPFGYRRQVVYPPERARVLANKVPKAKDEKVRLTPDVDEAAIVRELFSRYRQPGETLSSVLEWVRRTVPARRWSVPSVRWLLGNPAYIGDVVIGRRMVDEDDPGHIVRRPTAERWGLANAHEAIVDRVLFDAVAAKLAANRIAPRRARSDYVLSGVLTCAQCGSAYVGGGTKPDSRGGHVYFYRCSGALKAPPICPPGGVVARHLIEPVVVAELAKLLARPAVRSRIVAEVDRALAAFANPTAPDGALAHAERRALERQQRIATAIAEGTILRDEAATALSDVRQELARIEAAAAHEKFVVARRTAILGERDAILAQVLDASARLRSAHGPALRAQLAVWCRSLTYDRTRRTVRMEIRSATPIPVISTSRDRQARPDNTEAVAVREVVLPARKRGGAR